MLERETETGDVGAVPALIALRNGARGCSCDLGLRAPACATGDFCERGRGQGFGLPHSGGHDDALKSAQTILGPEKCALNLVCPVMGSGKRAPNPVCLIVGSEKSARNLVCLVVGSGKRALNPVCPIVGSEYRAPNPVCPVPGVWVACPRFRADRHYPHVGLSALRAAHPYPMNDAPDASGAPLRRRARVFLVSLILHIRLSYSFRLVLSFSPNFCCRSESEAGTGTGIRPAPVRDWLFLY